MPVQIFFRSLLTAVVLLAGSAYPFFYQTGWFFVLCGLLLGLVVYAGYRVRTQAIAARNSVLQDRVHMRTVELEKSQAQIIQLNENLRQRALALETSNDDLESFSYSVSHDLRAPLRVIDGFTGMLAEDYGETLPSQAQEYLQMIQKNIDEMDQLIKDLLDFSQLGRQALNRQHVDVTALAHEVFTALLRQQKDAQRQVEVNIGVLPQGHADKALLKQVWVNLLSNALKYTQERSVARIEVGSMDEQGEVVYFVRDNGVGFDMAYVDKLFEVFQRLHLAEEYEGTGVGLALVQRIIRRHGGRVWVEAAVNEGATFYFTLPKEAHS